MRKIFFAVSAALATGGCMTARIDVKYAPADRPGPISVSRMPKLFVATVEDRSGGFIYRGGGATQAAQLVTPLPDAVREAIVLELKRAGVPVVDARSASDAVLKAAVTAANESVDPGINMPLRAALGLSVQLRNVLGDSLWSDELSGAGSRIVGAPGFPGDAPSQSLNDALADAMRRLRRTLEEDGVLERVFRAQGVSAAAPAAAPAAASAAAVSSDLDELPAAAPQRPRSYAVVVGVEHYREKLPKADFAADDAKLAAVYFERVLGVPEANVAVLVDDRATKSDFEKYFERWLPNRVETGDTVYVYYSGHGAPNPAKGDAYLVPYDGDPTYIEQTGYPVKRLFEQLAKLPAKQVYVAMDSCFSGAGGRSVIAQGARPLVSVAPDAVPANLTVLAASAGDQISNGYQEKGHGLFTYFFLRGLKEKGGDIHAVFDYLKPEVARIARRDDNADQVPQWRQGP